MYIHTLHYITLHYITLHYTTLRYVTLRYITLHTYIQSIISPYAPAPTVDATPLTPLQGQRPKGLAGPQPDGSHMGPACQPL